MPIGNAFREIGRNAFVDWILVLVVSGIVGIGLIAGGVYLYWQITTGNFKSEPVDEKIEKAFDKQELISLIKYFELREETSIQIKKGYKGPADPSL